MSIETSKIALHRNCINPMRRNKERVIADVWTPVGRTIDPDDCIECEILGIDTNRIAVDYKFIEGDRISFYCLGCCLNIEAIDITFEQLAEYLSNTVESIPYEDIIIA